MKIPRKRPKSSVGLLLKSNGKKKELPEKVLKEQTEVGASLGNHTSQVRTELEESLRTKLFLCSPGLSSHYHNVTNK